MKRLGIRQQVAWLTMAPLLILAISLESFFLLNRFSDLDQALQERGKSIAQQLATSSEYGVFSNNLVFLQNIADGALGQTDVHGVVIVNAASEILIARGEFFGTHKYAFTDGRTVAKDYPGQAASQRTTGSGAEATLLNPVRTNDESMQIFYPIVPQQLELDGVDEKPSDVPRMGAVIVEMSRLRIEELKMQMLRITLTATALFLLLACYLIYLAGRSIVQPIRNLSDAIGAIGGGDLDVRVTEKTHVSELDALAQGLNEMTTQLQHERMILQQRIEEATQALRAKKEEAELASNNKSHFLAVASHDLRQPLHALGLYISELQHRVSGTEQQRLVAQAERSVEALATLLNSLLDISKLDAGTIVPQLQTCSVSAMMERIAADYQMLAEAKNIHLIVRACTEYAISDPQLLDRILMNLLVNAIRYTNPNGRVMVACRRRGGSLRIEVRDNGAGISKSDQNKIFREFFQVTGSQADTKKGLGLGLAIVDRLVKLLGYRLELRSAPGKGSVFAIEVPLAQSPKMLTHAAYTLSEPSMKSVESLLTSKRLLIVDDDPIVLSSTASIFASWGCIVSTAASLAQVEQFLRDGKIWDFIVSDFQLGNNITGIDVVAAVRQHHARQIPCVLISGDTSPATLELICASGHHLMHKPVRPAKLKSLVTYLLKMTD